MALIPTLVACGGGANNEGPKDSNQVVESNDTAQPSDVVVGIESTEQGGEDDSQRSNGLETVDILHGETEPVLMVVNKNTPDSEYPSSGGLDSLSPLYEARRTTSHYSNDCHPLILEMDKSREAHYRAKFHPDPTGLYGIVSSHWYDDQGYVILYGWGAADGVCQTVDYRYAPLEPSEEVVEEVVEEEELVEEDPYIDQTRVRAVTFTLVDFFKKSYGSPAANMRVTNTRNSGAIESVYCNLYALKGSTIVDTAFVYFANGGTIRKGESAVDDGVFFDLGGFGDFETTRQECDYSLVR